MIILAVAAIAIPFASAIGVATRVYDFDFEMGVLSVICLAACASIAWGSAYLAHAGVW